MSNDKTDKFRREKYAMEPIAGSTSKAHIGIERNENEKSKHLLHTSVSEQSKTQQEKYKKARKKAQVVIEHLDIIKDEFWDRRPWILSGRPGKPAVEVTNDQK